MRYFCEAHFFIKKKKIVYLRDSEAGESILNTKTQSTLYSKYSNKLQLNIFPFVRTRIRRALWTL